MTTLQFDDTHNLVVFLSKPVESDGFKQIVDFLNANPIRYALTINLAIYTSCIEQFWATVKEGTDCLPNATILEELTRMGYEKLSQKLTFYKAFFSPQWKFLIHTILQCLSAKTTAWNEFSRTMASAIVYEAVYEEMDDSLERAATTTTSLDAEQDRGNINKTQSKATLNEPSSLGTSSGSGPRHQETMGDTIAQTGSENVSKTSNDLLLARGNTLQSGEDRLKLNLKRRVKRLEKKGGSRTYGLKRLNKVGLSRRLESSDEEVSTHFDVDTNMFGVHDLVSDEVVVESEVAVKAASTIPVSAATTTTTVITNNEITLAKALAELKSAKLPTITEQAPTPTVSSQQPSQLNVQDKEEAAPAGEQSSPPAPKTAKQLTAKRNQERVKSILLLAIPDEYLLKFHNVPDAKSLWAAIKSRFGGNDESKKMQRNVLKHQFENFTTAPNESLDKAYDRFQKLISQLEVHAAPVSKEDINQKFLRSLPPSWSQIALIMRNKPDIDQTDIDDLYNNLRVYEDEMKRSLSSTSNSQNLAFLSSKNTSSTNEVSPASGNFRVNTAGGTSSSS
ncbi:hypothetical protein Tco_1089635 [Tanacetum coccineum]